ncbi:hypothetical protein sS8_2850 [Methylocaldum marinum]|uniref:Uncharacterized protein n=1 Tax=Methylocaldum marinum TaxID=1432792 RepID=A0A250KT10_9GAMM|nr:hypothetical protein sS8_2850 [Methylocaldum marinum]
MEVMDSVNVSASMDRPGDRPEIIAGLIEKPSIKNFPNFAAPPTSRRYPTLRTVFLFRALFPSTRFPCGSAPDPARP